MPAHRASPPLVLALALALLAGAAGPAGAGELSKEGFNELKRTIAQAIGRGDHDALARALHDLGKDDSARAVDIILTSAVNVPDGKVFDAAEQSLAFVKSDEALGAILEKLEKKGGHPGVKILCLDALARRRAPDADDVLEARIGAALVAAMGERAPEVVRAALSCVRARRPAGAVDALIDLYEQLLKRPDAYLLNEVVLALNAITGKAYDSVEDWRKWWEQSKQGFRPVTGGGGDPVSTGERKKEPKPTFFGTEINSERLVFVIDISGSMTQVDPGGKGLDRMERAKRQLAQCIEGLTPRSTFTVMAFSHKLKVWKPKLVPATPANKNKAKDFVLQLKPDGFTWTLTALKEGLAVAGADTIVLLSDGIPTEEDEKGERMSEDTIVEKVDGENRFKKLRIDAFGFGAEGGSLASFMKKVAERNGGKYTQID